MLAEEALCVGDGGNLERVQALKCQGRIGDAAGFALGMHGAGEGAQKLGFPACTSSGHASQGVFAGVTPGEEW